jgi:hypothetical protein
VDFLKFLREHSPSGTDVAIAAEDADYKEVVLHSDIVRLATMIVEYAAAPLAIHIIGAYLWDLLGSRHQRAEVRAAIVVHRKDASGEQTVRISFEGPAPNIEGALTAAIASLLREPVKHQPRLVQLPRRPDRHQSGAGRRKGSSCVLYFKTQYRYIIDLERLFVQAESRVTLDGSRAAISGAGFPLDNPFRLCLLEAIWGSAVVPKSSSVGGSKMPLRVG